MTRRLQAQGRPDAYTQTQVAKGQTPASFAGMGLSAAKAAVAGKGGGAMLAAAGNNVPASALLFSNPKGRIAQMRADSAYLGASRRNPQMSARYADRTAGGLRDVQMKKHASSWFAWGALKASSAKEVAKAGFDLFGKLKKMPPVLLAAPAAVAGVAALDRGHRGLSRTMDRMAEQGRFDAAIGDFDPAQFGDPSFQHRYEESPDEMQGALREAFGVLNRVAPNVAKDPIIAREYMRRMVLDPELRQPPEEYLRQVTGAVQLENQIQNAAPSLFDSIGGMGAAVLKG